MADAPFRHLYLKALAEEIAPLEEDLLTGRSIADWTQYKTKLATRAGLIKAREKFNELLSKLTIGEIDL